MLHEQQEGSSFRVCTECCACESECLLVCIVVRMCVLKLSTWNCTFLVLAVVACAAACLSLNIKLMACHWVALNDCNRAYQLPHNHFQATGHDVTLLHLSKIPQVFRRSTCRSVHNTSAMSPTLIASCMLRFPSCSHRTDLALA